MIVIFMNEDGGVLDLIRWSAIYRTIEKKGEDLALFRPAKGDSQFFHPAPQGGWMDP